MTIHFLSCFGTGNKKLVSIRRLKWWLWDTINFVGRIYPIRLEITDITDTARFTSYLDLHIAMDSETRIRAKLYHKRNDFKLFVPLLYSMQIVTLLHDLSLCLYCCCFVYRSSLYSMFYLYVCTIVVLYTDRHFIPCFIFMFVLLLFCIQIVTLFHVLSLCLYHCCFVYRSSLYSMI
jgi:hypothetical protein